MALFQVMDMPNAFRVSEACTMALHTVVLLADEPQRSLTTREMASTFDLSEAHLSKVLQRLARAGLVRSARGPKGGFTLARSPDAVTLMDVYESIEGPLGAANCLFQSPVCRGGTCILGGLLKDLNTQVREYLSKTKLADLQGIYGNLSSLRK